jgi:GNAT superfamily N-acetyltransferase
MISVSWVEAKADLTSIASFFSEVIADDESYISHGEIQTGLSQDGRTWSPELNRLMAEDLDGYDEERSIVVAHDQQGGVVGAAIIAWTETDRVSFGAIEDLAVARPWRSHGVGARMMAEIEERARERGAQWLFLESGLNNHGAHCFFERGGFQPISKVFVKPLK